ncbi:MipA/OmpV family protein [Sphingobium lignivorans]|uniref:Outer membrane protein n=1 Tax=Sphingobium lignivorans TaxID=2735886 RepID=A0ABR6NBY8_9SPHN|nr:MipA/OmpV family protein [Sphingobium lignivorans]MBB5984790.1 outer membrane protein [Sphingobium lignivorans]
MRFFLFAAPLYLFLPSASIAQATSGDEIHGTVYLGPIVAPDYVGSDEYRVTPFGGFSVHYGKMFVRSEGSGLVANLSPIDHVLLGPAINFRIGRRPADIKSAAVGTLGRIDDAWEAGGMVGLGFSGVASEHDSLEITSKLLFDVSDVHKGYTIQPGIAYRLPVSRKATLGLMLSATLGDDAYVQRYFGIDAADAAASGLAAYRPKGGLVDTGAVLTGTYSLSGRWSLLGIAGYSKLFEGAKNSPIVSDVGSSDQFVGSLSLAYSF